MTILIKNPDEPATQRQLYRLHQLTGEDTRSYHITKQECSNRIAELEGATTQIIRSSSSSPFTEADVTLVEGDQGQGKNNTATGMVVDDYYIKCIQNFCDEHNIKAIARGFDRRNRVARILREGHLKYIRIPPNYKLHSDLRIFSNYHLYGFPYVYIPTFGHLLHWLKTEFIIDGWLLVDEYYVGGNARDSMTAFGKELEKQSFQMRKMQLKVVILTPHARLIDKWTRITPTKHIICSYDKKRKEITLTVRKKGERGSRVLPPYDATQYWGNYWTNERIVR